LHRQVYEIATTATSLALTRYAPCLAHQAKLQALNDEVVAIRKKVEDTNEKVSDAERAANAQALDRKEKQLQRQVDDFRQDSQAESQQVFQRVAQKLFAFLQTYAQQHGYSAVIERGSDASPVVWYVADNMDITEPLIKAYDSQFGSAKPQTPGKPSGTGATETPSALPDGPSPHL
jgi:outer membrane protein